MISCALALSLVVDVSRSIDAREYTLQMEGMARAFRSERILNLIESNQNPIVVNLITFHDDAIIQIPWTLVHSPSEVRNLATRISSIPQPNGLYTNARGAINASLLTMDNIPCEPDEKVIDISADGVHNGSYNVETDLQVAERASNMGVRINALPILTYDTDVQNEAVFNYLNDNYVIPTGGFIIRSTGFEDFARAILHKLSMEIAWRQ